MPLLSVDRVGKSTREVYRTLKVLLTMWFQQPNAAFHRRFRAMNLHFVVLDAEFPTAETYNEGLEGGYVRQWDIREKCRP